MSENGCSMPVAQNRLSARGSVVRKPGRRWLTQTARPGEVDRVRKGVAVHEHGVLLADAEITEIDECEPQAERIAAPADGLSRPVKKVGVDERVNIPAENRRGRPRVQADPAVAGADVVVLSGLLRDRDRVRDKVVPAADRVHVIKPGGPDESSEPERRIGSRNEKRPRRHAARDELVPFFGRGRGRGGDRRVFGNARGLAFVGVPGFVAVGSVVGVFVGADGREQIVRWRQRQRRVQFAQFRQDVRHRRRLRPQPLFVRRWGAVVRIHRWTLSVDGDRPRLRGRCGDSTLGGRRRGREPAVRKHLGRVGRFGWADRPRWLEPCASPMDAHDKPASTSATKRIVHRAAAIAGLDPIVRYLAADPPGPLASIRRGISAAVCATATTVPIGKVTHDT